MNPDVVVASESAKRDIISQPRSEKNLVWDVPSEVLSASAAGPLINQYGEGPDRAAGVRLSCFAADARSLGLHARWNRLSDSGAPISRLQSRVTERGKSGSLKTKLKEWREK